MHDATGTACYRLLIIDDNPAIHDDIRKVLTAQADEAALDALAAELFGDSRRQGDAAVFAIDSAYQGEEGLQRVRMALREGQPYQVAFVDVRMPPGWDGVETIQRLWAEDPDLQCVICSAYSDYSWSEITQALGESDRLLILKKPFDPIEVVQMAHTLSRKWVLHKQTEGDIQRYAEELKVANEELRYFAGIASETQRLAHMGSWHWNILEDSFYWTDEIYRIFGYSPQAFVASYQGFLNGVHPDDREQLSRWIDQTLSQKASADIEHRILRPDGTARIVHQRAEAVDDAAGQAIRIIGTMQDVTERKSAEERIQFLAYYDALTGLPNRTLLQDRISVALARARRNHKRAALIFLDLDHFKSINDSLGHSVGDRLLQGVAERLKRSLREEDSVARLGGDEFLVLLPDIAEAAEATGAAQRIARTMSEVFVIQDHLLNITGSIGISLFPDHGTDIEALIKNADMAMYSAKENGRNSCQFFSQDLNMRAMERWSLQNSLRGALAKKELFLLYQPQVDIATGKLTGVEALIRWQHPEMGLVPPDKFIPVAEDSGLIVPIGEWVLKTACAQARQWHETGLPAVSIAVNISAVQSRERGFLDSVKTVLRETGLAPQYLELELTETLLISNADVMILMLEELKEIGLKLSIDDFGTGYSSLSYLTRFPIHKLKIDRAFVRDIAVNPNAALITGTIISMAKSLNIKVIAEGVESEAQLAFLRARQCDEIQGYYVSTPLSAREIAQRLWDNRWI